MEVDKDCGRKVKGWSDVVACLMVIGWKAVMYI